VATTLLYLLCGRPQVSAPCSVVDSGLRLLGLCVFQPCAVLYCALLCCATFRHIAERAFAAPSVFPARAVCIRAADILFLQLGAWAQDVMPQACGSVLLMGLPVFRRAVRAALLGASQLVQFCARLRWLLPNTCDAICPCHLSVSLLVHELKFNDHNQGYWYLWWLLCLR
jgi:hypothetical protein